MVQIQTIKTEQLSQCGDDFRTIGHSELLRLADSLATMVLNLHTHGYIIDPDLYFTAEGYRALRIECAHEAGRRAERLRTYD